MMFAKGIEYIQKISELLPEGLVFYGEYLQKEKHNTLTYKSIPKNHISLFGIMNNDKAFLNYGTLCYWSNRLDIDVVPILYYGAIKNVEDIKELLQMKSYLGGPQIEGVVIKNHFQPKMIGDTILPITCAKLVSEEFKEKHKVNWKDGTGKNKWDTYKDSFGTEARWNKAVQRMKEEGIHTGTPKDIGTLMSYVQQDIKEEEEDNIKGFLWGLFGKDLLRASTSKLPEWYKNKILEEIVFPGEEVDDYNSLGKNVGGPDVYKDEKTEDRGDVI
jgi:hypothetical protein